MVSRRFSRFRRAFHHARKPKRRGEQAWTKPYHRLPGAWVVIDTASGRICDSGSHFQEMVQLSRAKLINCPISILSAESSSEEWSLKCFNKQLIAIEGRHEDVALRTQDDRTILVDVHVSPPIQFGSSRVAVCLITDGTERQRLQRELIEKHKELRKAFLDLEQKSDDLLKLNGEIGELSAILSHASSLAAIGELTAELTHQLNNPLAAAVSTTRRIDTLMKKHDIPGHEPMIALLKDSHRRLQETMGDLKQVYRNSRASNDTPVPIDLNTQLQSAMMLLQQRLAIVNMHVSVDTNLPPILGRPSEIQHVIVNLIDNALQAVEAGGTIDISAKADGDRVRLWVGDSGPGIPLDRREQVFEPFYTTREQGSGLGLSVVRRNVENNKATIRVGRSELGGAEFEIGFMATGNDA